MIPQMDKAEVEKEIENLELQKTGLDNKIQVTNWNTKLMNA